MRAPNYGECFKAASLLLWLRLRQTPALFFVAFVALVLTAHTPASAGEGYHVANEIPPTAAKVFASHCLECHNADDSNGGLDFSNAPTLLAEGDSGDVPVVPGSPELSQIVQRILTESQELRMPPEGARLSEGEISAVRAWIAEARAEALMESAGETADVESDHWSFQPLLQSAVPDVAALAWSHSPIDRFLQAKRESLGLSVAEQAQPETLLRRATFALTGLPPTRQEQDAFLAEIESGKAIEEVFAESVDQLLSRQTYGQRWGRHWMDWVRYADTAGCNSDFPIPQAYLYRNYIVDSLNDDMPYDQFLSEQLAGDLMESDCREDRNRKLIATGYLAMARRFGSLVETYPWHLTIEDTIDNVGRTMMGLTLSCARCHDHKFDPISTRDYYGLYGIFESTQYAFPGIELFQVQKDMVPLVPEEQVDEILGKHKEKALELEAVLTDLLKQCRDREIQNAELSVNASVEEQRKLHSKLMSLRIKARNASNELAAHLKTQPEYEAAYAVRDREPRDAKVQIKGEPARLGATVERRFPEVLGGQRVEERDSSGRLELAQWITSPENPLTARVIVNRVWQRHFGRGLVESTSDFGLRGQTPSHPELLDWLATDFMQNGWSLKHLHRQIMNSRSYRMESDSMTDGKESAGFERNVQSDPENRFLWKFTRQRLDAESIRDALLAISGRLDCVPQSEPYPIPPQKDWKYTQHHPFNDDYANNKRSLYQMTKRLTVESYMQTFDGPDPNVCTSDRDQSVTALQALYFVNDEFLHQSANAYAERLVDLESKDQQIEVAVQEVLGRPVRDDEKAVFLAYLGEVEARLSSFGPDAGSEVTKVAAELEQRSLASMVRGLFRLNEFLYID